MENKLCPDWPSINNLHKKKKRERERERWGGFLEPLFLFIIGGNFDKRFRTKI
jgi:hypothetical protein